MTSIHVQSTGGLTLVQDLGRSGWAHQGVGQSGAADRTAFALAQRLVGNPADAAALETTLGGLQVRPDGDCIVAVTGAEVDVDIDGSASERCRALLLRAGQTLRLGTVTLGLRTYTAVRGGVDVERILGSRSRDTLGGIGPPPLRPGDELRVGGSAPITQAWFEAVVANDVPREISLTIIPGPHDDVLDATGWQALTSQRWTVHADSDRIGVRLDGPPLNAPAADWPSFPVVPGAVQLPAHGRPIVLGADAGVTGGYPVLGVVEEADLSALAQAQPGTGVRFFKGISPFGA